MTMNFCANRPLILKETSAGYSAYNIEDEMLSQRKVVCLGEINAVSVNSLILQLMYLQEQDSQAPITIYINSPGGEVSSGLALYDVMQMVSCPIHTVCIGMAASMAAILFASGDHRLMLPHSKVMIHDPLTHQIQGSALQIHQACDNLMQIRDTTAGILAKHTGKDIEEILCKTASDSYFSAKEAIEFGLADEILGNDNTDELPSEESDICQNDSNDEHFIDDDEDNMPPFYD